MQDKPRVGIVNATSYTGAELVRLLARHPGVRVAGLTARSQAGQELQTVFPHLARASMPLHEGLDDVDVVFLALPHHAAAEVAGSYLEAGARVVDLSADFRLADVTTYERWYGSHPCPELLPRAVYGLPELWRSQIADAQLVANPGCYPTASQLALAPALREGLIEPSVIVDAKSGVSGAGRGLSLTSHFSEVNESCRAYGLDGHRHMPEMAQGLSLAAGRPVDVLFVPHLVPMTRGILATCYARLTRPVATSEVIALYRAFYEAEPFVEVAPSPPQTKQVWGSNYCLVHPVVDAATRHLVVVSCIDNLVKGASGQAIQNMNLMLGLPETMGLEALPYYP